MIEARAEVSVESNIIVEGIRDGLQDGTTVLLKKFGRGLRFLARRYCECNAEECCDAAIKASIEAIHSGAISRDEEMPALLLKEFKQTLLRFSEDGPPQRTAIPELLACDASKITDVQLRMNIFTPLNRKVLVRFYVKGESISTICRDLNIKPEQVDFLRAVARMASRVGLQFSQGPIKKTAGIAISTLAPESALAG